MKVLKIIGKVFLGLLVAVIVLAGLLFGRWYLIQKGYIDAPDIMNVAFTNFDHDRIREFDKWSPDERDMPSMYVVNPPEDRSWESSDKLVGDVDAKNYSIPVWDAGTKRFVGNDVGEYLKQDYTCSELYGVDPDIDLFADNDVSTVSFRAADYIDGTLFVHDMIYFRGVDTKEYDYHLSSQGPHGGAVGSYKKRTIWHYKNPEENDEIEKIEYSLDDYLDWSYFIDYLDFVRHWDGESVIIDYYRPNHSWGFIYDIEINPELDDYLFTPESLLRYHKLEFYKDMQ
jgi:hypothetical protein